MRYYLYAAVVGAILFFAIQEFSKRGALDKYGTTVEQAITIERVRADLVEIASAENENITVHMHCLDLDDLIESKGLLKVCESAKALSTTFAAQTWSLWLLPRPRVKPMARRFTIR
jgi:hypothetical protein